MDLMDARRRIVFEKPIVENSFTLRSTSNAYTSVDKASYDPGDVITAIVKSVRTDVAVTRYVNGYFSINTPLLDFDKEYIFTASIDVTEYKLNSNAMGIASVGVGATEKVGYIVDGIVRIKFVFTKKSGSNDKYLEFHLGGKSCKISNIKIWKA